MIKTITREWLQEKIACQEAQNEWQKEADHSTITTLKRLMVKNPNWANWLIVRVMTRKQYLQYAIYAAMQVIKIYEAKYPNDKRPRQAILAAKKCLKHDTKKNRDAAADAAAAASYAAAADAYAYADDPAYAAADARKAMQVKILKYGINLLK
jgi:dGTP triphosphohydrolase